MNYGEYCNTTEDICDVYFNLLNNAIKMFEKIEKQPNKSRIDYIVSRNNNKEIYVELKNRKISIFKYDTIFIEPKKFEILNEKNKSYYINFLENSWNKFWICDIKKLNIDELLLQKNVYIRHPLINKIEDRLLIPITKGQYYEFDIEKNKLKRIL